MEQKTEQAENTKVKKPIYKKWWFWLIIGLVIFTIIGVIFVPTEEDKSDLGGNSQKGYYIGDTVTTGDIQYTVNSVYDTTQIGSSLVGENTQNNFVVISLTIKNTGNREITLTESNFVLHKNNAKYNAHTASIYLDNGFYVMETIGAGNTTTIQLVYEVPDLSSSGGYTLKVSYSYKTEIINLTNKK